MPAANAPNAEAKTFETGVTLNMNGLTCSGANQADGKCDNYYIGKLFEFYKYYS